MCECICADWSKNTSNFRLARYCQIASFCSHLTGCQDDHSQRGPAALSTGILLWGSACCVCVTCPPITIAKFPLQGSLLNDSWGNLYAMSSLRRPSEEHTTVVSTLWRAVLGQVATWALEMFVV
jgi:hypothetical protein